MVAKMVPIFCISAFLVQIITAQCIGKPFVADELAVAGGALAYGPGLLGNNLPYGAGPFGAYGGLAPGFAPSSGGAFPITSASPISPTGITVVSENAIEGILAATGELPFLSAVAFEGALPSGGAGGINYGCGGAIGIVSEGLGPAYGPAMASAAAMAPARLGYGAGLPAASFPAAGFPAAGLPAAGLPAPGFPAPGLAPAAIPGPGFGYNRVGGFGPVF